MRKQRIQVCRYAGVFLCLMVAGCGPVESIREALRPESPHEEYRMSLESAGLSETALGRDWIDASTRVLEQPSAIELPFQTIGYFPPDEAAAAAYRFEGRRGEVLSLRVAAEQDTTMRVFMDLFQVYADTSRAPQRIASADSTGLLEREFRRDGAYVLRLQPELLRGGRYTLMVQTDASLAFPVFGRDTGAIRSFFGADRDGGRRRHHGVDIFAPRGTPVVAVADGYVTRANVTRLGGKVVWVRTLGRRESHYYAHLDSQYVRPTDRVRVGDTLGVVGNTGNARTTPPHLHFGIYSNGPVDPLPFIDTRRPDPARIAASLEPLGTWMRSPGETRVWSAPEPRAEVVRTLPQHTTMRVVGASKNWYRVELPDRSVGFVPAGEIQSIARPVRQSVISGTRPVHFRPDVAAPILDQVPGEESVAVLGTFGTYLYVETTNETRGWVSAD